MSAGARSWQLPLLWPQAPAAGRAAPDARLLKAAIVFALLALTVLDRFGLRINAEFAVPPGLVAMYGLAAAMLLSGAAELNLRGAATYAAVVCVAGLSLVANATFEPRPAFSVSSFMLLLVLYAPFALSLGRGAATPELWRWTLRAYIGVSAAMAAAGIAQFSAQFFLQPEWLFNYTQLIPEGLRASGGWNTVYAMAGWVKSNGFFLREPSIFSIAMALALLCELSLGRRKWIIALFVAGLVLSYSGSGLVCLGVALLFPLGLRSVTRLLGAAAIGALVYFVLGDLLDLSYTVGRVDEFASSRSSAYCRFVYPGLAILQQMDANAWSALLGHGPGTMVRMGATCADGTQTTYAKLLFEYGLAGAAVFGILILCALDRPVAPVRVRAALAVTWLLLGGNLIASELLLLVFLLCAMWPRDLPAAAEGARP